MQFFLLDFAKFLQILLDDARGEHSMPFGSHCFDHLTTNEQEETIREIEQVMEAVYNLGPDPDPEQIRKLFAMLKPGDPAELKYVTLKEAA